MGTRRLTEEQREVVERTGSATVKTRLMLAEAANAYAALGPLDEEGQATAREWVERIAVVWREAEQAGITHVELAEEFSTERTHLLLGAIQDSLILLTAGVDRGSERLLDVMELARRIEELHKDGAFTDGLIKPRAFREPTDEEAGLYVPATRELLEVVAEATTFFPRLVDQRGRLEGELAAGARAVLLDLARAGRDAEARYPLLVSDLERFDPRPSLQLHRSMVAALVLRLSADPDRQELAVPLPWLGSLIAHVREGWKDAPY